MKRIGKQIVGLMLGRGVSVRPPRLGRSRGQVAGKRPAYELIGKVAVLHEGRIKPLDTVAREEVKQIYGRETIKLHDPAEEIDKILDPAGAARKPDTERPVQSWGPVGAFYRLGHRP